MSNESISSPESKSSFGTENTSCSALVLTDLTTLLPAGEVIVTHVQQLQTYLPIIVMTGHTTHDVAMKLGGDLHLNVLAKPLTSTELQTAIQTALDPSPPTH